MKTLEMISDWEKSNCKKKYIRIVGNDNHYTVYNNGLGVLFYSYVNVTLNKTLKEDGPFMIIKDVFEWEWQEIVTEYNITEAFKKTEQGDSMISLESGITLNLKDSFTKDEILNKWIEKFI